MFVPFFNWTGTVSSRRAPGADLPHCRAGPQNFDALTGKGLRDRAYTWTASSYLLLAEAHAHREGR
ncbi:hypothetical protein GCM10010103_56730 [Streptomyces paradoxus]|uniref:Uncharacterized protein n=1 Tax=Streptomyces paradoxus TaxID=66375 RepID=A0A7W9TEP0_9ACTN|nr:hypothetical protein [Streptomyces paradoxus]MBB6079320.1 hypothetical protein [Streptomyces paradoxus]